MPFLVLCLRDITFLSVLIFVHDIGFSGCVFFSPKSEPQEAKRKPGELTLVFFLGSQVP